MTECIALVQDCPDCRHTARRYNDPDHVCDDLCGILHRWMRDPVFHANWHKPNRHGCGATLQDADGTHRHTTRLCPFQCCVQWYCPGCRREIGGYGRLGCPCANTPNGHGTWAEHAKPHPPVKGTRMRRTPAPDPLHG